MIERASNFDELFDLLGEFDRLFRRRPVNQRELPGQMLLTPRMLPVRTTWATFDPPVECFARDNMIILRMELPGVDPRNLEISIAGPQIVLRGEKKWDEAVDEKDVFFREMSQGRFERSFTLPETAKADQVKASFLNGVLEVVVPTGTAAKGRTVPIEIGGGGKSVKAA
jgi:HSP20 family protein